MNAPTVADRAHDMRNALSLVKDIAVDRQRRTDRVNKNKQGKQSSKIKTKWEHVLLAANLCT